MTWIWRSNDKLAAHATDPLNENYAGCPRYTNLQGVEAEEKALSSRNDGKGEGICCGGAVTL